MKKNIVLILSMQLMAVISLSQIPNYGFENWNNTSGYWNPESWGNLNGIANSPSEYTCVRNSPGNTGNYHLTLTTMNVQGKGVVPGIAVSGKIDTTTYKPVSGFPFSSRPAQLNFYVQYMPYSPVDSSYVSVTLTKWDSILKKRDTIGFGISKHGDMAHVWINSALYINYTSGDLPDSACIVISASGDTPYNYSYIAVDDLQFSGNVLGVSQNKRSDNSVLLFPNPTTENFSIAVPGKTGQKLSAILTDVSGKIIFNDDRIIHSDFEKYTIDPAIQNGIYLLKVNDQSHSNTLKLIIHR